MRSFHWQNRLGSRILFHPHRSGEKLSPDRQVTCQNSCRQHEGGRAGAQLLTARLVQPVFDPIHGVLVLCVPYVPGGVGSCKLGSTWPDISLGEGQARCSKKCRHRGHGGRLCVQIRKGLGCPPGGGGS